MPKCTYREPEFHRPAAAVWLMAALFMGTSLAPRHAAAQDAGEHSLPGGASSIQETYQDWQVACAIVNNAKQCSMSQQQRRKDGNQLVLAAEFAAVAKDGSVSGTLVLPFGLLLSSGVKLQVDDKAPTAAYGFRTCLPSGCIVPLALDKATVASLRSGTALKIMSTTNDGQPVSFSISLNGFQSAQDRLGTLAKQ